MRSPISKKHNVERRASVNRSSPVNILNGACRDMAGNVAELPARGNVYTLAVPGGTIETTKAATRALVSAGV